MRCRLLEEDPELGRGLADQEFARASRTLLVDLFEVEPGQWNAPDRQPGRQSAYLLVSGKLLREVRVHRHWNAELLLGGDILRPWLEDSASFMTARWTALEPSRLARLDVATIQRLAQWPALVDAFVERTIRRSRSLAAHSAIQAVHKVEDRLLLLFWHLAERCGEVKKESVVVPIDLKHEELARLIGAQRPTVTTGLLELRRRRDLERTQHGWVLHGDAPTPPAEDPART